MSKPVLPSPTMRIRRYIDDQEEGTRLWLFLDYGGNEWVLLDERCVIEHRARDDWWGIRVLFPWTAERMLDRVADEMALAKEAIEILRAADRAAKEGALP